MLKGEIDQSMNVNTLGAVDQGGKMTATEVSSRNNAALESQRSMYNRLNWELVRPLFDTCWAIMHETGLVPQLPIDGQLLDIEYNTPIQQMNNQSKINKVMEAAQYITQIMGPEVGTAGVVYGLDIINVPEFVCKNIGVDYEIENNALGKQKLLNAIQGMMQQQSPQQQLNSQPTGASNPSPLQGMAAQQ